MVIFDIVLDGPLPESLAKDVYAYVGCISGAAQRQDYFGMLKDAGLGEATVLKDVDYLSSLIEAAPSPRPTCSSRNTASAATRFATSSARSPTVP